MIVDKDMIDLNPSAIRRALFVAAAPAIVSLSCAAQAVSAGSRPPGPSKVDLYGGYAYFHPVNSDIYNVDYQPIVVGGVTSATAYFSDHFGVQAEGSFLPNGPNDSVYTVQGGLAYRLQWGRLVPFAHLLGGEAKVSGPAIQPATWGVGATAGMGIDYILPQPGLHNRIAIRPVQADFAYSYVNYGARTGSLLNGGIGQVTAFRLSAGVVFRFGNMTPPLPAAYGCELQPVSVYAGDPIQVTGRVINLAESKHLTPTYTWSTSGGKIVGNTENATVATGGLAAGDYVVTGRVSEGAEPTQHAECTASFRVMAFQPPTISCSANPTSVQPGGFSTITAQGTSPQNRPLNYSYGATAGQITGSGTTGTLATADVPPGVVTVTCNVVDDVGKSASTTTMVSVVAPPPPPVPPAPSSRTLCSLSFERDLKRPVRVDNEAKACLDSIALELNRESDATLVVVGKHDPGEKPEAAAERTLNVKQYLTTEKGIDASRIEVRTGETKDRSVDDILVPAGATWDPAGTTSFDPTQIQRHGQPYAPTPK
jgi:hypothetical protein